MSDADITADEPAKGLAKQSSDVAKSDKAKKDGGQKRGLFSRIALFFRQTVAELRKVIYPTRKELIQYTWVVLVFVLVMGAFIGVLDFVFAKGVLAVFGN